MERGDVNIPGNEVEVTHYLCYPCCMEIWKAVPQFEGFYEVSNRGRVKNLKRYARHRSGGTQTIRERILKPTPDSAGYPKVVLHRDGKRFNKRIHSLVLGAFVGPRPKGKEGAHNDGCPDNCNLDNLEYKTPKENAADKLKHGTRPSKLTSLNVLTIRQRFILSDRKNGGRALGREFGVFHSTIRKIISRETWAHI